MFTKTEICMWIVGVVSFIALIIGTCLICVGQQSKRFNRLTGANVTRGDAFFIELRIVGLAKRKKEARLKWQKP